MRYRLMLKNAHFIVIKKQSCYMLTQRTMKMGVDVGTDL